MQRRSPYEHHQFRPAMPFGPGMVKEMSQLVFLWTISEETEGITGYDLQKNYKVKQTNVYRTLKGMEEKGLITSEEAIVKGRAQKLYKITEQGREKLRELRENWTNQIAFLSDIVPPPRGSLIRIRHSKRPSLIEQLKKFKTKEEAKKFLHDLEKHYERRKEQLQQRMINLNSTLKSITEITTKVEKMDGYSTEEIEKIIQEMTK